MTDKLRQGKAESRALTPKEKYDTWEEIKIKSTIIFFVVTIAWPFLFFSISNHKYAFVTMFLFVFAAPPFLRFHKDSFFNVGYDVAQLVH